MTNSKDSYGVILPNSKRTTKFGNILRKTSLDELPELFMILFGKMSFIGPRPLLVEYLPYYSSEEIHRHDVRPGLSGLAQINGRNNISSWEERFRYDLQYVNECSFLLDLRIALITAKRIVEQKDILAVHNNIKRLDEARGKKERQKMKKLGIIGGGWMAGIFANNAREMGIETHCFSPIKGIIDATNFDYVHDVDILKLSPLLKACKAAKIDGVVATTELTISPAAYIAKNMHLVGISYEVSKKITNKLRNRDVTKHITNLNHPKYATVNDINELKQLNFVFPIILKPTSSGGKRGITVIKKEEDIKKAFNYAMKESNGSLPFIVEEFIDGGTEYSVESLSFAGKNYIIQITEKVTSGPPHCVELAHHQPANISENLRSEIINTIDKSLDAIGLTNGPCHTEIKIKNNNIYLIEFNARPGGDHIAYPLTELSTGYPYIKGAIEIALNIFQGYSRNKNKEQYAGVIFISEQTKEFKEIFDDCEKKEWCYKKNYISNNLEKIVHNDGFNRNYFIYRYYKKPNFNIKGVMKNG